MTSSNIETQPIIDQATFRNVAGHFASGVTVITTKVDGQPYGTTASAVSSLSMDPPMMLICLNRSSNTHDAVKRAGTFVINILAADQGSTAYQFAGKGADKFAQVQIEDIMGLPTISGALATIVCRTTEETAGGTHTVFFAEVLEAQATEAEPLAYYKGKFGRFNSEAEDAAYLAVRRWVLSHRELKSKTIPLDEVAKEVELERERASRALAKLATDRLVSVGPGGVVTVLPITPSLVTGCLEARAAIQCGVLVTSMESLSDESMTQMRSVFEGMKKLRESPSGNMQAFLELNTQLQNSLVGLASSTELTQAFNRMGLGAVWYETVSNDAWEEVFVDTHQVELMEALEARDSEAACRAVQAHAELTIAMARRMLEAHGGEV